MTAFIRNLRLLLLGMWLGAAIFFGAAVAPSLFGVLRAAGLANADELAGSVVSRLLAFINKGGLEISLFLFVTAFFVNLKGRRLLLIVEVISVAIMAIMTGISHWVISARMMAIRASLQMPIDQVPMSDPRRLAFDALHQYSVTIMGVAIVAALIAFFVMAQRSFSARAPGLEADYGPP
jgi:hypothetical protein